MAKETFIPTGRDWPLKSATRWLKFKTLDDKVGKGLWRIHDSLYDFRPFIELHPGGHEWSAMTEGQDITEAFEVAHIRGLKAEAIAKKYFKRKIDVPRNSQTTFKPNGKKERLQDLQPCMFRNLIVGIYISEFYMTLKQKVAKIIYSDEVQGPGPTQKSLLMQDFLAFTFLSLLVASGLKQSWQLACLAGLVLGMNTSCAHNFFHQSDMQWRRFYFDLSLLSSRDWRVSHMLSHHLHTNTYNDIEIYGIEPFLNFLPSPNKNWIQRYLVHLYINLVYFVAFHTELIKKVVFVFILKEDKLRPENSLPFLELGLLYLTMQGQFLKALAFWGVIHGMSGFWLIFTSLIASHHHPDIYHAGDTPR